MTKLLGNLTKSAKSAGCRAKPGPTDLGRTLLERAIVVDAADDHDDTMSLSDGGITPVEQPPPPKERRFKLSRCAGFIAELRGGSRCSTLRRACDRCRYA